MKKGTVSPIPASLGRSPSSLHQSVYTRHKTEIFWQQRYTKLSADGGSSSPAKRRQCFPECRSSFKTMGRNQAKRREGPLFPANVYTCSAGLGKGAHLLQCGEVISSHADHPCHHRNHRHLANKQEGCRLLDWEQVSNSSRPPQLFVFFRIIALAESTVSLTEKEKGKNDPFIYLFIRSSIRLLINASIHAIFTSSFSTIHLLILQSNYFFIHYIYLTLPSFTHQSIILFTDSSNYWFSTFIHPLVHRIYTPVQPSNCPPTHSLIYPSICSLFSFTSSMSSL